MVNIGRMGIFQKERRGMTVWPYFFTRREICILSLNLSEIPEVRYQENMSTWSQAVFLKKAAEKWHEKRSQHIAADEDPGPVVVTIRIDDDTLG